MRVTVFGSGYVGLVVAACLAETGNQVICVDVNKVKIQKLQHGIIPIYEPGLQEVVQRALVAKKIEFTTDANKAISKAEFIFIAVGTPQDQDGSADLQYVLNVAQKIGEYLQDYTVVVNKSTVPVGTADKVQAKIQSVLQARNINIPFDIVSNPEFLKEGEAIEDFTKPDRIVLGLRSARAEKKMRTLYAPFAHNPERLIIMNNRSAELTKYAANVMLATKISLMNQLANLAEKVDADIDQVRLGIGSDPRIGPHFIYSGCGYGGSCFGKDVKALIKTAAEVQSNASILQAVESVNLDQKRIVFDKIVAHFNFKLADKTLAIWGLAFKSGTDDMRDAPSRVVLELLWQQGAKIQAFDPKAMEEAQRIYGKRADFTLAHTPEEALEGADALVFLTDWMVFRSPSFETMRKLLKNPVIVDGRNLYDPIQMEQMGFIYYGIGRGKNTASKTYVDLLGSIRTDFNIKKSVADEV
ncbi:MAG TPA: UDP-glucose/GDP-mannose dehydrogenase family protein [Gammaproteobacteria bacterium]|nr:UDP-glucose/GDP-mannose dehydrogenase family protein [Gammaproteobacteria bacterium]